MANANTISISSHYQLVDLKPGEIHIALEPTFITTLLGSCVAVCLYSTLDAVGAMSHSVLPSSLVYSRKQSDIRYVESAIGKMIEVLTSTGIPLGRLRAKVFGGAEMFHKGHEEVRLARIVGGGNIQAAKQILGNRGICVVSECVGGNSGRKLIFDTATGVVYLRKLSSRTAFAANESLQGA